MSVYQFVRAKKTGDPIAKAVLIALAHYANWEWGACYPSAQTLADDCDCDERTVRRKLEFLQRNGLITLVSRPGKTPVITLVGYREYFLESEKIARKTPVTLSGVGGETPDFQTVTPDFQTGTPDRLSDELTLTYNNYSCSGNGSQKLALKESEVSNEGEKSDLSSKTTTTGASVQNLDQFATELEEAAKPCLDNSVNCQSLANLSVPLSWVASGCSVELDILPTLRAVGRTRVGKRVRSWSYFTQAVHEARDRRASGKFSGQAGNNHLPSLPDPKPGHEWKKGLCRRTGKMKWVQQRKQELVP